MMHGAINGAEVITYVFASRSLRLDLRKDVCPTYEFEVTSAKMVVPRVEIADRLPNNRHGRRARKAVRRIRSMR